MVIELLSVRHNSWHPWLRCGDIALLGNLNLGWHTRMNVNGFVVDVILGNESDLVDVILENKNGSCIGVILRNGPVVGVSQID